MKIFIALTFYMTLAAALHSMEFQAFKAKFGKSYRNALEEKFREKIFLDNLKLVQEHNALYRQGKSTFELSINKFADLTNTEFTEMYTGHREKTVHKPNDIYVTKLTYVPDVIDWRTKGYVTPVKDQKQCGSCWAFSATGSLEGQHFKATGNLVSLSEQNLVDCSKAQNNFGCQGGWMNNAFEYVILNNGIATEASYPYEAVDGSCRFNDANVGATAKSYINTASGDENALKNACAEIGPISVAIDASGSKFQFYKTGVYDNRACSSRSVNHGVLVVGYGNVDGNDFWIVKNSWGINWGDNGYIKMSRNKRNQCAIASYASFPIV